MLPTLNPKDGDLLILATRMGEVKALKEGQLSNIQARGLIVMDLEPGDELVSVAQLGDAEDVVMVSENGQAIRFPVRDLAPRSRTAGGVRGMRLREGDRVVAMNVVTPEDHLLVVSRGGYAKSTPLSMYPTHNRGGMGVRTFRVTEKTGPVAEARVVPDDCSGYEVFILSAMAQVVRINLEDVRIVGRDTSGVIIWRDRDPDDYVASIACFHEGIYPKDEPSSNGHRPSNGKVK
jgi:DNA gyrase subunit A